MRGAVLSAVFWPVSLFVASGRSSSRTTWPGRHPLARHPARRSPGGSPSSRLWSLTGYLSGLIPLLRRGRPDGSPRPPGGRRADGCRVRRRCLASPLVASDRVSCRRSTNEVPTTRDLTRSGLSRRSNVPAASSAVGRGGRQRTARRQPRAAPPRPPPSGPQTGRPPAVVRRADTSRPVAVHQGRRWDALRPQQPMGQRIVREAIAARDSSADSAEALASTPAAHRDQSFAERSTQQRRIDREARRPSETPSSEPSLQDRQASE